MLKLILGELTPDSGTVRAGTRLAVAYFDQFRSQLDEQSTLVDVISPGGDFIEGGGRLIEYAGGYEDARLASLSRASVATPSGKNTERERKAAVPAPSIAQHYGCSGKMNALIPNGSLVVHA